MKRLFPTILACLSVLGVTACRAPTSESSEPNIVKGRKVPASSPIAKGSVALVTEDYEVFCSGSLISEDMILTAAHCLEPVKDGHFYVAFATIAGTETLTEQNLRDVKHAIMHPQYSEKNLDAENPKSAPSDVALIQLSSKAPDFATGFSVGSTSPKVDQSLTLAGYGITRFDKDDAGVLRQVSMKVQRTDVKAHEFIFQSEGGKSACMGDSGGPALEKVKTNFNIVGVTSRGDARCHGEMRYTDVTTFKDWIRTTSKQWNASPLL